MLIRCAVRTGPERSSLPPKICCTTPNVPLHGLLLLKAFPHVIGGVPKLFSLLTIHVTVIGHGPAFAGTVIVRVRVSPAPLIVPPPVQFPPGVAVSWTLLRFAFAIVVANVMLNVAVQLELL